MCAWQRETFSMKFHFPVTISLSLYFLHSPSLSLFPSLSL